MSGNREALEAASEKIWNYTVTELGSRSPFFAAPFFCSARSWIYGSKT